MYRMGNFIVSLNYILISLELFQDWRLSIYKADYLPQPLISIDGFFFVMGQAQSLPLKIIEFPNSHVNQFQSITSLAYTWHLLADWILLQISLWVSSVTILIIRKWYMLFLYVFFVLALFSTKTVHCLMPSILFVSMVALANLMKWGWPFLYNVFTVNLITA